MKLRLPILLTSAVMACFVPVISLGVDGFNINFVAVDGNPISGSDLIGLEGVGVAADNWNNITPSTANQWYEIEKDCEGNALNGLYLSTTKTMTTWTSGNKDTTLGEFLSNYHDDSGSTPYTITLSGVPYLETSVYLYMSGDGGTFSPMSVNGVTYIGADGDTVEGTGGWGDRSPNQTALVEGTNVLVVDDVVGGVIEISNVPGSGRGTIAGIQVVDSYEGVRQYRTLAGGEFTWGDAAWSTTEGVAGSNPWADGAGHAAVINASASGSNLILGGTVSLDGIILESGSLTLSDGMLTMTGASSLIVMDDASLKLEGVSWSGNEEISWSGLGRIVMGADTSLPSRLHIAGTTLVFESDWALPDEIRMSNGVLEVNEGCELSLGVAELTSSTLSGTGTVVSTESRNLTGNNHTISNLILKSGVLTWSSDAVAGSEIKLGDILTINSGAELKMLIPASDSSATTIASSVLLEEGGVLNGGLGWADIGGNSSYVANIILEGIEVLPTETSGDTAVIHTSSYKRSVEIGKLNGSGILEISRHTGINGGGAYGSESSLTINGVDDDESKNLKELFY